MQKKYILALIFALCLHIAEFFMGGISLTIQFFLGICFYGAILYLISCIWKKLRRYPISPIRTFAPWILCRLYIVFGISTLAVMSFSYYHNDIRPASVPEFTISNGEKTVVFQSMIHIGNADFYRQIQQNIREKKKEGFVLFFEGVKPGSKESHAKLNEALRFNFKEDTYQDIGILF